MILILLTIYHFNLNHLPNFFNKISKLNLLMKANIYLQHGWDNVTRGKLFKKKHFPTEIFSWRDKIDLKELRF